MGSFATATELGEILGLDLPSDLSRWQALLQTASDEIRSFTGQVLSEVVTESVEFGSTNDHRLFPPEIPITAITSVTVGGVLQVATTYDFTPWAVFHVNGQTWPNGATVVYSHGYTETSPDFSVFRAVAIEAAGAALTETERSPTGGLAEQVGWRMMVSLTDDQRERLKPYGVAAVG